MVLIVFHTSETAEEGRLTMGFLIPDFSSVPLEKVIPQGLEMQCNTVWPVSKARKPSTFETWPCHLLACRLR